MAFTDMDVFSILKHSYVAREQAITDVNSIF